MIIEQQKNEETKKDWHLMNWKFWTWPAEIRKLGVIIEGLREENARLKKLIGQRVNHKH